jgi:tripeptidyl-peptidase-1
MRSPDNLPGFGDAYLQWFHYVINQPTIPRTISIAHGSYELEIPEQYAQSLCLLFGMLGLRGTTVLAQSGDVGVGVGNCMDSSGNVKFNIFFPASCPWVTSVGGTMGDQPEIANSISSGGFSIHFERPAYQNFPVTAFLNNLGTETYAGLYNPDGRGIPDIAMQSLRYIMIFEGQYYELSSTRCSTNTAAAIVSLLNDYRLSQGQAPLGWLNPWLYQPLWSTYGLNDVTFGNNPGCGTPGFSANIGWDPVTGLGSMDFQKLLYLLQLYPNPPIPS